MAAWTSADVKWLVTASVIGTALNTCRQLSVIIMKLSSDAATATVGSNSTLIHYTKSCNFGLLPQFISLHLQANQEYLFLTPDLEYEQSST
jgi:hypothetical protein